MFLWRCSCSSQLCCRFVLWFGASHCIPLISLSSLLFWRSQSFREGGGLLLAMCCSVCLSMSPVSTEPFWWCCTKSYCEIIYCSPACSITAEVPHVCTSVNPSITVQPPLLIIPFFPCYICVQIDREMHRDFAAPYEASPSSGKLAVQACLDTLGRYFTDFWIVKRR